MHGITVAVILATDGEPLPDHILLSVQCSTQSSGGVCQRHHKNRARLALLAEVQPL